MAEKYKYIGFCCAAAHKEPLKPIIDCLADLVKKSGRYRAIIYHCFEDLFYDNKNDLGARTVFEAINYEMLDAMVLFPNNILDTEVIHDVADKCARHNVPVISVDGDTEGAFKVFFGYGEAFGAIVEHVIEKHNCKKIKLFAGIKGNDFSRTRIDACAEVMRRHGLELREKDVMYGDFWETPTYKEMDKFFESGEPIPDAFVCCNDSMAMAVCLKLNEHGYRVPRDVIVTGFDGIEMERYHTPRLCTAVRDNSELAAAIIGVIDRICDTEAYVEPFAKELLYKPVFSESCGCTREDNGTRNRQLSDFVRNYSASRTFEEHMDVMENRIAADPTPENVRSVLRRYGFGRSAVCITESFRKAAVEGVRSIAPQKQAPVQSRRDGSVYPQEMSVFVSTYDDGSQEEDISFSSDKLMPCIERAFGEYETIFVMPIHFQDTVIGYYVTPYVNQENHNDRLYTFTMSLNRCLEQMRLHEYMLSLNHRLSFLYTHDRLTGIFNRYGFYESFHEKLDACTYSVKDVFIASIDLNDMKYINDNFGHSAGDDALIITAKALIGASMTDWDEKTELKGDGENGVICARFGGDEFVAAKICSGDSKAEGERYHERFNNVLSELNRMSGYPFEVHASFGVYASSLDEVDGIDSLIELADRLMYSDKAKHKRKPRNVII